MREEGQPRKRDGFEAQLTRIEGGRVDCRGIDGRTLSAVWLVGGIHTGRAGDDRPRACASWSGGKGRNVEQRGACRTTCLDIVGLDKKDE